MWTCKKTNGSNLEFYCDGVKASNHQVHAYFAAMSAENNHLRLELESAKAQLAKFKKSASVHYMNELKISAQSAP